MKSKIDIERNYESPLEFVVSTMLSAFIINEIFLYGVYNFSYIAIGSIVLLRHEVTILYFMVVIVITMIYIKGIKGNLNNIKEVMISLTSMYIFVVIGQAEKHLVSLFIILAVIVVGIVITLLYIKNKKEQAILVGRKINVDKLLKRVGKKFFDVFFSIISFMAIVSISVNALVPFITRLIVDKDAIVDKTELGIVDMNEYYEKLYFFNDDEYNKLTIEEKLELFEHILAIESNHLGIDNNVKIAVENFDAESKKGHYDHNRRVITLDIELVKNEPIEAIEAFLHEIYHVYQGDVIDVVNEIGIDENNVNTNLRYFREVFEWKKNWEEYVSVNVNSSDEDYWLYYMQSCETSARDYATHWIDWYTSMIYESSNE